MFDATASHFGREATGRQRGLSDSLQWVVLTPLVMLALLGLIQAGLLLHGRSTVQQAAMAGAEAQAALGASSGVAERVAVEVAESGDLTDVTVTTTTNRGLVTVTVHARVRTLLDFGTSHVTSSASLPQEGT